MFDTVANQYAGTVSVVNGRNPKTLHLHQVEAIKALNGKILNQEFYEGLLVLPTGGGKTHTAVQWVLRNIIDNGQKVLWIAHRHELLNQALHAVKNSCYSDVMQNRKAFNYRVISGMHDRPIHLKADDDFVIASKDSLVYGLPFLMDNWVRSNTDNIFLIIDEAHHAVAKSYRTIINELKENNRRSFKLLGLTATPFRTSDNEKGLLKLIFKDDITYAVDLKTLISREILADPVFIDSNTQIDMACNLTDNDIKTIHASDILPRDVAEAIALNKNRNSQIVNHYLQNQEKYDKTLVFALNVQHAIELKGIFAKYGVKSEFVVSSIKDSFTGVTLSKEHNKETLQAFKEGKLKVLINVNILTEGVDLPSVQTVFLTRPTISTILMTQMIGRALRGQKAGGTKQAYIVTFIDEWKDKIAWVNPRKLYEERRTFTDASPDDKKEHIVRLIAISKIEEFARMMDETVDTSGLEKLSFIERLPIGIYSFSFLMPALNSGETGKPCDEAEQKYCDVMVFNTYKQAYEDFIADLDHLFESKKLDDKEFLAEHELEYLSKEVEAEYFVGYDTTIGFKKEDIKDILRYYAQTSVRPAFLAFEERENYNVSKLAARIWDNDMGEKAKMAFLGQLWNDDASFLRVFFGDNKKYFVQQINNELYKISYGEEVLGQEPTVKEEQIHLQQLALGELRKLAPQYWRELVNKVFEKSKDKDGFYNSASGNFRSPHKRNFQIDHIKPMSKGGLTEIDNLQLLTIKENLLKGSTYSDETFQEYVEGRAEETKNTSKISVPPEVDKQCAPEQSITENISVGDDVDQFISILTEKIKRKEYELDDIIEIGAKKYGSAEYFNRVGKLLYVNKLNLMAKNASNQAVEIGGNTEFVEESLFRLANISYYDEQDVVAAEGYSRKLTEMNPNGGMSQLWQGMMRQNSGEFIEALKCYDKAIEAGEDKLDILMVKAEIFLMDLNKPDEALGLLIEAKKINPDDFELDFLMGMAYFQLNKFEEARSLFEKVVQSETPNAINAYFYRAECLNVLGKFSEAIADYSYLLQTDPSDVGAYIGRAKCLHELKKYSKANADYDAAIKLGGDEASVLTLKGQCLQEMNRHEEAFEQFKKAIEKDPDWTEALFGLGDEYRRRKRYNEAINCYERCLSILPDNAVAIASLGYMYMKLHQNTKAIELIDKAIALDPEIQGGLYCKEVLSKRLK